MKKIPSKRGRPCSANPLTPAQRMRAYRARKRAAGLQSVSRWVPESSEGVSVYSDHRLRDARSLALHCKIVNKISGDLDLLGIPKNNLRRWRRRSEQKTAKYLDEWQRILKQPWPAIADFITSFSENAIRLRQSSPFAGVLDPKERKRIYEAFRT